jgi:predicted enzyme related to lactoylglutathione lyase
MPQSETELVLFTDPVGSPVESAEVDLLVDSTDAAVGVLRDSGGRVIKEPFDISVGRCAVVVDPFGNQLVVLDLSKGLLRTDAIRNVVE